MGFFNHFASDRGEAGVIQIAASTARRQTQILSGLNRVIGDGGGWVHHQLHARPGLARMVFEFPRDICLDVYGAMVSLGLELSAASHRIMEELCRCTPYRCDLSGRRMAVEDSPSLQQATAYLCSLEFLRVELSVRFAAAGESESYAEYAA
jgi:hypothetical protein